MGLRDEKEGMMPREYIQGTDDYEATRPNFELHWSADEAGGNAQISMSIKIKELRSFLAEWDAMEHTNGESEEDWGWFFSDQLSRPQLNKTIRVLRRMRNAVYGADE